MPTATETKTFGFYIDGRWHTEGERIEIRSPGTGELAGVTHRATAADVEAAIAAATGDASRRIGAHPCAGGG
jgi:acyl-CoA reductase-like NAD-dependent aldehyde dehydrogenase